MTTGRWARGVIAATLLATAATGCRHIGEITIGEESEVDPQFTKWEQVRETNERLSKTVAEQRAKNEAEFRARNPGVKPPVR